MDITLPDANLDGLLTHPLVHALLETSSDGVVIVDAHDRTIRGMNRRARDLLGFTTDDPLGCQCKGTMNSPSCLHECPLTEILEGRPENSELDLYYRGADGDQVLHARTRMIVVRAPDGTPLAGVELFQDLSEHHALRRALSKRRSLHGIVGRSAPMQSLYDLLEQVGPYDLPALITGESGVGKERFADAIVELSGRRAATYRKINCATLNPDLLESELFGHTPDAAPRAPEARQGALEAAHGGTVLLDQVTDLPLSLQARLLRLLERGEVQRTGGVAPVVVDVRVIATTSRPIEDDVSDGMFREDLFYRLGGVRLHVPPLRDRLDDIPDLVDHFFARFAADAQPSGPGKQLGGITDEALKELMERPWRGNVRELENVLRLAWIRTPAGGRVTPELLQPPGAGKAGGKPPINLAALEEQAILRAMDRSGGNMAAAARLLGIDRSTLWRKMKKSGLN